MIPRWYEAPPLVPGEPAETGQARPDEGERPPRPAQLAALDQRVDQGEGGRADDEHAAAVQAAQGRGPRVALTTVPSGPNAIVVTERVRALLAEGGLDEATIPAALDLLGLFVTGAALDRVPEANSDAHRQRLRWEIDVILSGLIAAGPPVP
jgi:hypothetical protein